MPLHWSQVALQPARPGKIGSRWLLVVLGSQDWMRGWGGIYMGSLKPPLNKCQPHLPQAAPPCSQLLPNIKAMGSNKLNNKLSWGSIVAFSHKSNFGVALSHISPVGAPGGIILLVLPDAQDEHTFGMLPKDGTACSPLSA